MSLRPELSGDDPLSIFRSWLAEAERSEPNDPNAAALATSTRDGVPSVRMVLIKGSEEGRFSFYTNAESRKGRELAENPSAALCFHWKSLRRQVRVSGPVTELPDWNVGAYFHSRSRRSQIGAAVSLQSRPLESRSLLEEQVEAFAEQHAQGEIDRPSHWRGYALQADLIEFWIDGADRLHDRRVFILKGAASSAGATWSSTLLYP